MNLNLKKLNVSRFPRYSCASGAWSHLHVPGVTEGRGSVFIAHSAGHPLKPGGDYDVRGHAMNWPTWTPEGEGGVRKT